MKLKINYLSRIVKHRHPVTAVHQQRTANIAVSIGKMLNLSDQDLTELEIAAKLHDVGKIFISEEILNKKDQLNHVEIDILKFHPHSGFEILRGFGFPARIRKIVNQHHERLNGSGYPLGLMGDDILLSSRILTVADVVDAMLSDRPYRKALKLDMVRSELSENQGIIYDKNVVSAANNILFNISNRQ